MGDGFVLWPKKNANIDTFRELLHELNHSLKLTVEKRIGTCEQNFDAFAQVSNFLDFSIILHQNDWLETDIFYKETNLHDYLNHFSHHPKHIKQNIQYILTRCIIKVKMINRSSELKTWLLS